MPRQLPAGVRGFAGRAGQLAQLDALLPADGGLGPGNERAIACYRHETAYVAGDLDAAGVAWQRALAIYEELDHPNAEILRTKLAE